LAESLGCVQFQLINVLETLRFYFDPMKTLLTFMVFQNIEILSSAKTTDYGVGCFLFFTVLT